MHGKLSPGTAHATQNSAVVLEESASLFDSAAFCMRMALQVKRQGYESLVLTVSEVQYVLHGSEHVLKCQAKVAGGMCVAQHLLLFAPVVCS